MNIKGKVTKVHWYSLIVLNFYFKVSNITYTFSLNTMGPWVFLENNKGITDLYIVLWLTVCVLEVANIKATICLTFLSSWWQQRYRLWLLCCRSRRNLWLREKLTALVVKGHSAWQLCRKRAKGHLITKEIKSLRWSCLVDSLVVLRLFHLDWKWSWVFDIYLYELSTVFDFPYFICTYLNCNGIYDM